MTEVMYKAKDTWLVKNLQHLEMFLDITELERDAVAAVSEERALQRDIETINDGLIVHAGALPTDEWYEPAPEKR